MFSVSCTFAEQASVIKHSADGWSGKILQYQQAFMRAAVANSHEKYGPFHIDFVQRQLSSNRTLSELAKGSIDSAFGSGLSNEGNRYMLELEQIRYPYVKTLHGLRRCLTTDFAQKKVSEIQTLQDLKTIHLGQGVNWPELKIYDHYSIRVHSSINLDHQLEMLSLHRFECLPLSVLEIDHVLEQGLHKHSNLVIAPNFYIFYPNPIFINLGKKNKASYDAIKYGVKRMFENGDVDKVFNEYYDIDTFHEEHSNLILFDNPLIDEQENSSTIEYFMEQHIGEKNVNVVRVKSRY